jgi:hypothetical protein
MSGGLPDGSGRAVRLDPFALPVRFSARDAAADGRLRDVELTRERVVVRRAVRGMKMALNLPLSAYRGIAIRVLRPDEDGRASVAVVLEHKDPGLALELYVAPDGDEVAAEWRTWGAVLGLPLLVSDNEGDLQEPFERIGRVRIKPPSLRRRRRHAINSRRPSILLRRVVKRLAGHVQIHRGEREIIARN